MPAGIRPLDNNLQSFQPPEPQGPLGAHLCHAFSSGGAARRSEHRVHRSARAPLGTRRKRGAKIQAIGRSRGGPSTKIHALTDACGRAAAFIRGPGNGGDISSAPALSGPVARFGAAFGPFSGHCCAIPCQAMDKGYDANSLPKRLAASNTEAVIPSTKSRKRPIPHDAQAYSARNLIKRTFGRPRDWRRIATRYDKLAINVASAVAIAAVSLW